MEYIRIVVKKNLKALRESLGLKGYEVAEKAGISQASYSRFESGGWISDPESLEKIANFYGIPSSRIYYDSDAEKPINKTWSNKPSPDEIIKKLEETIALLK